MPSEDAMARLEDYRKRSTDTLALDLFLTEVQLRRAHRDIEELKHRLREAGLKVT